MTDKEMNNFIVEELQKYVSVLEASFHDMVDLEFTIEKGTLFLLSTRVGKRTELANLKIVINMFCEGKMNIEDVILKLPYYQIENLLNTGILVNANELKRLSSGLPASSGVGSGTICFSYDEATSLISAKEDFIYCRIEISPDDIQIISSHYCQGTITARGGITSHAAVVCRGIQLPCVSGAKDFYEMREYQLINDKITIDGNNGCIYAGIGSIKKNHCDLPEIKILYELLKLIIKYNIINSKNTPLIWRLWDVIVLGRRHKRDNTKRMVNINSSKYMSFIQPTKNEIVKIGHELNINENSALIIEDFIGFLISILSTQVSIGRHYLYMRPLLNPMESMHLYESVEKRLPEPVGIQITGIEFFNINQFIDFLIDVHSVKLFFSTEFYYDETSEMSEKYLPLNYLDYTNPNGESLIINTYNAIKISLYINNVLIPTEEVAMVYHLIRRRAYHWAWYRDNNVTKNEIQHYLISKAYLKDFDPEMHNLCEEMHLIEGFNLTTSGISLLGRKSSGKQ